MVSTTCWDLWDPVGKSCEVLKDMIEVFQTSRAPLQKAEMSTKDGSSRRRRRRGRRRRRCCGCGCVCGCVCGRRRRRSFSMICFFVDWRERNIKTMLNRMMLNYVKCIIGLVCEISPGNSWNAPLRRCPRIVEMGPRTKPLGGWSAFWAPKSMELGGNLMKSEVDKITINIYIYICKYHLIILWKRSSASFWSLLCAYTTNYLCLLYTANKMTCGKRVYMHIYICIYVYK